MREYESAKDSIYPVSLKNSRPSVNPKSKRKPPLHSSFQQVLIEAETSSILEPGFHFREMVGSLSNASTGSRPDILAAVGIVSRFLSKPKAIHCDMV